MSVKVVAKNGKVPLQIEEGIGIAQEDISAIFEKFNQASGWTDLCKLGLYIYKYIIEVHNRCLRAGSVL